MKHRRTHSDAIREVHAARFRLYADNFLNLTTEIIDLAQHDLAARVFLTKSSLGDLRMMILFSY